MDFKEFIDCLYDIETGIYIDREDEDINTIFEVIGLDIKNFSGPEIFAYLEGMKTMHEIEKAPWRFFGD